MVKMKPNINNNYVTRLKAKIREAYAEVISTLNDEFDEVISDPNEFNDLGFYDQDIIDTERFLKSKMLNVQSSGERLTAFWIWDPVDPETGYHYGAALYTGFMAYGRKWIPGRPWVERAIARVNPTKALHAEMRARGVGASIRKKYSFGSAFNSGNAGFNTVINT